jgi:hypothetical protein
MPCYQSSDHYQLSLDQIQSNLSKTSKGPDKSLVLAGACSVQLKYIVKTDGIIFQLHVLAGCMFCKGACFTKFDCITVLIFKLKLSKIGRTIYRVAENRLPNR